MKINEILCERAIRKVDLTDEDWHANDKPPGPETPPEFPAGTVKVDVSDVYDWYKLGQHISDLEGLGHHDFGQGPPSTILAFGSEEEEEKYIKNLKKLGLKTHDIDPPGLVGDIDESRLFEEYNRFLKEASGYKEIEFVCANPEFSDATDPELQKQMYHGLQKIPGVIPLFQDQSEYSEGQYSLAAIYKDRPTRSQILKLAKSLGVQVDLEQPVSDDYVDRAIRGEHYGQQVVAEASGYIPSEAQKDDPRFKTALTVDVHPDSIQQNAKRLGSKIARNGVPPTLRASGKI